MSDTVLRGAVAGALAGFAQALLNWAWMWLNLAEDTLTHLLARAIFIISPAQQPIMGEMAFALFGQLLFAGIYGVGVALLLRYSQGASLLKGGGFGAFLGVVHLGLLPFLARVPQRAPLTMAALHLGDHIVWGVLTAYLVVALAQQRSSEPLGE